MVDVARHIHRHAVRIGKDGEIARARRGPRQAVQRRARRLHELLMLIAYAPHGLRAHHVERHPLIRRLAARQATPPRALDPVTIGPRGRRPKRPCAAYARRRLAEHCGARIRNLLQALFGTWIVLAWHKDWLATM
ncbi:hypothetical protein SDC9_169333 [bioreactor metagenome]|uniref:Uncharacterized protein n=1 Tax=bioreactor metagenome TaxID=1076179 RepID=A0A645G509_9ZZZZ